jgi:hypothetical protein
MSHLSVEQARAVYAELMPWFNISDKALNERIEEAASYADATHDVEHWFLRIAEQDAAEADADSRAAADFEEWR